MKRLYYLTEDMDFAEHISAVLTSSGISEHHIHVLSKDEAGVTTHHLHGPNILERVDFVRVALNGMGIGMMLAIITLFVARILLDVSMTMAGQIGSMALLMLFGTWLGGMIGFTQENRHLRRFHEQIEKGRHLIMIDVHPQEEPKVHRIIELLNEAEFSGEDEHVLI